MALGPLPDRAECGSTASSGSGVQRLLARIVRAHRTRGGAHVLVEAVELLTVPLLLELRCLATLDGDGVTIRTKARFHTKQADTAATGGATRGSAVKRPKDAEHRLLGGAAVLFPGEAGPKLVAQFEEKYGESKDVAPARRPTFFQRSGTSFSHTTCRPRTARLLQGSMPRAASPLWRR